MKKIKIITKNCRRCGKLIASLNKSLYGLNDVKKKYDDICNDCATIAEKQNITDNISLKFSLRTGL